MKHSKVQSSTLDEDEVRKFSKIADSWWDENGEFVALQRMNDLRVPLIRDGLMRNAVEANSSSRPLQGQRILDVGCGGGILAEVSPVTFLIVDGCWSVTLVKPRLQSIHK